MRYVNCLDEIMGGVVVDSCGTVLLPSGEEVVWCGIINPEWKGEREYSDGITSIVLPMDFAI